MKFSFFFSFVFIFIWALGYISFIPQAHAEVSITSVTSGVAVVNSCITLNYNLRFGLRDPEVVRLQTFLIARGSIPADYATGYFGPATLAAIRKYQYDHNIDTTGFVGPLTRASIQSVSCQGGTGISTVTTKPTNTVPPRIYDLSTHFGPLGTQVTIYGRGFDDFNNTVIFGNVAMSRLPSAEKGTSISFRIPEVAETCSQGISSNCVSDSQYAVRFRSSEGTTYHVYVSNVLGLSNWDEFLVTSGLSGAYSTTNPIIFDYAGPANLNPNKTGIWIVLFKHLKGVSVSLSAYWGDEGTSSTSFSGAKSLIATGNNQTSILAHTYASNGQYTPTFMLTDDDSGRRTQVDVSTVTVGTSYTTNTGRPVINALIPERGATTTQVMIMGTGFTPTGNTIRFGQGVIANVPSYNSGNALFFTVPSYINPCDAVGSGYCQSPSIPVTPGTYQVIVYNGNGQQTGAWDFYVSGAY